MSDQWIEAAAEEIDDTFVVQSIMTRDAVRRDLRNIIAKHHACLAVTAERLLEQVEAIAETIRGKVEDCPECKRVQELSYKANLERLAETQAVIAGPGQRENR